MLFNSIEFAIFLPIVFLLYWLAFNRNIRIQNLFIVVVSYLFYGWWDWRFLILIAFTSFCSWGSGLLIDKYRHDGKKDKIISIANIVLNLTILGVFKYYDFFISSLSCLFDGKTDRLLLNIILPVGISFYTFQALSYSIDVYKQKLKPTRDLIEFFAFVSFFPQLVAGPIERATNLLPQFQKKRVFDYSEAINGCRLIIWGLFKKMVVADNCAIYVDKVFNTYQLHSGSTLLLAAILFAFQIYGDFSGYSDIAIGTSKLFGIKLMRNFNVPYFSRDIAEFWRKWHISLTTWFRDYIYIPLGGSRCSKSKVFRNTIVIFLVSGLWHGANWTFVAWGTYHAVLFLPLILLGKNRKYKNVVAENKMLPSPKELLQITGTFIMVVFGWIIFRADSCSMAWDYILNIFNPSFFSIPFLYVGTKKAIVFCVIMILTEWIFRKKDYSFDYSGNSIPEWIRIAISYCIVLLILEFSAHSQSFIYFQF